MGGQQTLTTIFFCAEIGNLLLIRPSSHSCAAAAITSTGGFAVGSRGYKDPCSAGHWEGRTGVMLQISCFPEGRGGCRLF